MTLISRVYQMGPSPPPVGADAAERNASIRAEAWHRLGLAIIDPEDITDEWLRQGIIGQAERMFGKRDLRGEKR